MTKTRLPWKGARHKPPAPRPPIQCAVRRSALWEILNRDIVPRWARRWQVPATLAFYLLIIAIFWIRAFIHWQRGLGVLSADGVVAVLGTFGLLRLAAQALSDLRRSWRNRGETAIEAMRPDGFDDRCARCGYDLTGTTRLKCPECGAWHGRRRTPHRLSGHHDRPASKSARSRTSA